MSQLERIFPLRNKFYCTSKNYLQVVLINYFIPRSALQFSFRLASEMSSVQSDVLLPIMPYELLEYAIIHHRQSALLHCYTFRIAGLFNYDYKWKYSQETRKLVRGMIYHVFADPKHMHRAFEVFDEVIKLAASPVFRTDLSDVIRKLFLNELSQVNWERMKDTVFVAHVKYPPTLIKHLEERGLMERKDSLDLLGLMMPKYKLRVLEPKEGKKSQKNFDF